VSFFQAAAVDVFAALSEERVDFIEGRAVPHVRVTCHDHAVGAVSAL
jgi:hypothetical protein